MICIVTSKCMTKNIVQNSRILFFLCRNITKRPIDTKSGYIINVIGNGSLGCVGNGYMYDKFTGNSDLKK